jgi:hypothetical protein
MLLIALLALTFGFREPICLVGCCGDPDAQSELAGQSEAPMPCHGDSPVEQAPTPGPEQAMECSGDAVALPSLAPSESSSLALLRVRTAWRADGHHRAAPVQGGRLDIAPAPLDWLLVKSSLLI